MSRVQVQYWLFVFLLSFSSIAVAQLPTKERVERFFEQAKSEYEWLGSEIEPDAPQSNSIIYFYRGGWGSGAAVSHALVLNQSVALPIGYRQCSAAMVEPGKVLVSWTAVLGLLVADNSGDQIDFVQPRFVGMTVDGKRIELAGKPPFLLSPEDGATFAVTRYSKKGLFGSKWDGRYGLGFIQMLRRNPEEYSWGEIAREKVNWILNEVLVLDVEPGRSYFVEWKINEWAFFVPSGRTSHSAFLRSEHEAKNAASSCRFAYPIYIPTGAIQ